MRSAADPGVSGRSRLGTEVLGPLRRAGLEETT